MTPKQRDLLIFIAKFFIKNQYMPSIDEMCEHFKVNSKSGMSKRLRRLQENGFIIKQGFLARSIEITDSGWRVIEMRTKITGRCPACNQSLGER